MEKAILKGETPSLFLLQYTRPDFFVTDVLLIPNFVFTVSILQRRNPLSPDAERAGWIGCNFLLDRIPPDARIYVIENGKVQSVSGVRENYRRLRPLAKLDVRMRGWTLDVLNLARSLKKDDFTLAEVYAFEHSLAQLHPHNANIRPKIRQQLQILRDLGLLTFLGDGSYHLT